MWILLLGAANISQVHSACKHLQQSLVFVIIPALSTSLKLTGITVTKMTAASPLHQIGDGERYLKQNCPV
jgi:response regulator RpfG family c-di-GMP phosphodiesterase